MYFVNFHYGSVSLHARTPPQILRGNGDLPDPAMWEVPLAELVQKTAGRHVLFLTHGFNVSYAEGARSLARLAGALPFGDQVMIVPVLWPGDFYVPAVNYPAASVGAIGAGQALGDLCNAWLAKATTLSFVSHSLGARVVLEAVGRLKGRRARMLCVTAGAVNDDCLTTEYADAVTNAEHVYTVASAKDRVLQLAYPVGDLIGQIFTPDHGLYQEALGRHGPSPAAPVYPQQIPCDQDYDHGNYLPSSKPNVPPPASADPLDKANKWKRVRDFIQQAYGGAPQAWPVP
jgi:hypothetical protein